MTTEDQARRKDDTRADDKLQWDPACSICDGTGKAFGKVCACRAADAKRATLTEALRHAALDLLEHNREAGACIEIEGAPPLYVLVGHAAAMGKMLPEAAPEQAVPEGAAQRVIDFLKFKAHTVSHEDIAAVERALSVPPVPAQAPIQMILHCPKCGVQHIDAPETHEVLTASGLVEVPDWANPPHRSHLCHGCGNIWRPADVHTEGVKAIQTRGTNDSAPGEQPSVRTARKGFWDVLNDDGSVYATVFNSAEASDYLLNGWKVVEQPSTPVPRVASIDTAEFRELLRAHEKATIECDIRKPGSMSVQSTARAALIAYIDAHVARQAQAAPVAQEGGRQLGPKTTETRMDTGLEAGREAAQEVEPSSVRAATDAQVERFWSAYNEATQMHGMIDATKKALAAALAATSSTEASAQAAPTDLSKILRDMDEFSTMDFPLLKQAADEIDRYYGGMLAWKRTAEAKDGAAAQAAPAEQRDAWLDEEALRDAVTEGLRGLYGCGRVWSAWSVGTMTEDDFHPAEESDECVGQVMDAIRALRSTSNDSEKGGAA